MNIEEVAITGFLYTIHSASNEKDLPNLAPAIALYAFF